MDKSSHVKKTWEKPSVQMLNINKDTYGLGNKRGIEQGNSNGESRRKRNS